MRGIATLILAAAMVIGSVVCASASAYQRDVPPPWGIVDDIGSLSYEPMPDGGSELGPFLGPPGPQCDILFVALHNGDVPPPWGIVDDIGSLSYEPMPDGGPELGPFLGPPGPQCDILFGALHNGGSHIAGNVGALNACGSMPNPYPLDEGVMPGPCPDVLFGGAGTNCGAC